jgi:hypothetical protein
MSPNRISTLCIFSIILLAGGCHPEPECPVGQTKCAGVCTDLAIDSKNCGSCATACPSDQGCQTGACNCTGNLTSCSGLCTDLQASGANCGACSHGCATGTVCSAGQCRTTCPADAGLTNCSGSCVDLTKDPQNCGSCSHSCQAVELCEQGACQGPDLFAVCFSGSLVGYHSQMGPALTPFTVSVPASDGGAPIVPGGLGLLFTDSRTLWLLDTSNSRVDVLDITQWPPAVLGSVPTGQAPNQLVLCDGLVLVVNSVDGTVQGIDAATRQTVNEVFVGAGTNPYLAACDAAHGAYVTDWVTGDVKAVNLTSWTVTATFPIPSQDVATGAMPYPQGVAFATGVGDAGAVFVALGNAAIDGGIFGPLGDALVLELDPALQSVRTVLDPGTSCTNGSYLGVSRDGIEVFESCGGVYGEETSGFIAPIATSSGAVGSLIPVPLANPSTLAVLKNGLLAVDGSGNQVVVFNPNDAGIVQLLAPCPTLPDGGTVSPFDFVGGLVATP